MIRYDLDVLTPRSFNRVEEAAQLFELLDNLPPSLRPERCGPSDPPRGRFTPERKQRLLQRWKGRLSFERSKPYLEGYVSSLFYDTFHLDCISLWGDVEHMDHVGLVAFLRQACICFEAYFGYLHIATPTEFEQTQSPGLHHHQNPYDTILDHYTTAIGDIHLSRNLPDLMWATVLGAPYLSLFGREHLLASPAYQVEALSRDSVYLQLSETPLDLVTDYARVDAARTQVKHHLNHNAFFDCNLPPDWKYNVPRYCLVRSKAHHLFYNKEEAAGQIALDFAEEE